MMQNSTYTHVLT